MYNYYNWIVLKMQGLWETVCMPLTQRTAQILATKQKELAEIRWTDGEANTDSGFSKLACGSCEEAWVGVKEEFPEYSHLSLTCSPPDINLRFTAESIVTSTSGKIELKSGKGTCIPGSTIGSLNINEPVIFCLRNDSASFAFRYSQYYTCMGESNTDMFQDRTPRPHVNFQNMADINTPVAYTHKEKTAWVEHYAKCALFRTKTKTHRSWQDTLTATIIRLFIKETSVEEFARLKAGL